MNILPKNEKQIYIDTILIHSASTRRRALYREAKNLKKVKFQKVDIGLLKSTNNIFFIQNISNFESLERLDPLPSCLTSLNSEHQHSLEDDNVWRALKRNFSWYQWN